MGYPTTEVRLEEGGDQLTIGAAGKMVVEAGATVTGLTGQTTFASAAETKAGSVADKVLSPSTLHAALVNCKVLTFTGHNLAGTCTLTGAAVGDKVIGVAGLTDMGGADASFEATITVADQIQQSAASDLHAKNYLVMLLPIS
jgi:hypothetical protein